MRIIYPIGLRKKKIKRILSHANRVLENIKPPLGVPDRFIDAFQGRIPRSVLARHYTDYSLENLKQIYDKAGLKVLS